MPIRSQLEAVADTANAVTNYITSHSRRQLGCTFKHMTSLEQHHTEYQEYYTVNSINGTEAPVIKPVLPQDVGATP